MGALGGSGAGKSKSYNKAYGFDIQNFGPMVGMGGAANSMAGSILGLNNQGYWVDPDHDGIDGNDGQSPHWVGGGGPGGPGGSGGQGNSLGALQNYFNSSGGQFQLNQGLDNVTARMAGLGLTKSGAAMKALEGYRHDLASTKLDNYLGQLNALSQQGLGAGGLITSAGQKSKSTGAGGGIGSTLGGIGGLLSGIGALSEREAKTNIERIGDWDERGDGLGKYRFAYKRDPENMLVGVMADEVEQLRPAALGAKLPNGWRTVNYSMLEAA